jgi:iron uptake system component EfeO
MAVKNRWTAGGVAGLLACVLALAACGNDDGDRVRTSGGDVRTSGGDVRTSGGETSGSGSGSGTGLSSSDLSATDNPLVNAGVDQYKQYLVQQVDALVAATTTFTNAVRAGDVGASKAAYAPSRVSWERIEPIAGLVPDIDGATDSRVDDFEGVDDPNFTGWHRLEYLLWAQNTTEGGAAFADKLDADLASLKQQVAGLELPAGALPAGAADLIEEVSEGKITGEENRYSHTDLWDFAANIDGSKQLIVLLTPAIEAEDPDLVTKINAGFTDIDTQLAAYEDGNGGYVSYEQLTDDDKDKMKATLAALSENVSQVGGTLGLK